jgi:hypothetical protein
MLFSHPHQSIDHSPQFGARFHNGPTTPLPCAGTRVCQLGCGTARATPKSHLDRQHQTSCHAAPRGIAIARIHSGAAKGRLLASQGSAASLAVPYWIHPFSKPIYPFWPLVPWPLASGQSCQWRRTGTWPLPMRRASGLFPLQRSIPVACSTPTPSRLGLLEPRRSSPAGPLLNSMPQHIFSTIRLYPPRPV